MDCKIGCLFGEGGGVVACRFGYKIDQDCSVSTPMLIFFLEKKEEIINSYFTLKVFRETSVNN